MTTIQRCLVLGIMSLVGCSLATDFGSFEGPNASEGGIGDGDAMGNTNGGTNGGDTAGRDGGPRKDGGASGGTNTGTDGSTDMDAAAVQGQVNVALLGNGTGSVKTESVGIDCGADCSEVFPVGTMVVLRATPSADSLFKEWGGDCAGQVGAVCMLTAGAPAQVTAEFTRDWFDVTVTRIGNGSGVVSSSDAVLHCDGTPGQVCSARYLKGASVTLEALASQNGSGFSGWGGACAGTAACVLTVNATAMINAVFDAANEVSLIVSKLGRGGGTVISDTGGISCGNVCAGSFTKPSGGAGVTSVVLTATSAANSELVGFTGCKSTSGATCTVEMDAVHSVTVEFALKTFFLNVVWNGQGTGSVGSADPDGLACTKPNECKKLYEYGTTVSLAALPGAGSNFVSWSGGGCGANVACEVTVTDTTYLVANFALNSYALTAGAVGVGTVLCNGAACPAQYLHGTPVTFSVEPGTGWELLSWGGDCSGKPAAGTCALTITKATNVIANFRKRQLAVSVTVSGSGSVAGAVPCASGVCNQQVEYGTELTLTAAAADGNNFAGWSGDCGGTGSCVKTVTGPLSVTATFAPVVMGQASLALSKNGKGTVSSTPAGISCGPACGGASAQFAAGSTVTLNASHDNGYAFSSFSGCTSMGTTCQVAMTAPINSVTATFTPNNYAVNVSAGGTGFGSVTATGINCGNGATDCSENRPFDSVLTLTVTPAASSTFVGWGGACSGVSSTCDLTVSSTSGMTVTATFALKTYQVQITKTGGFNNQNTVSRSPSGSVCGTQSLSDCGVYNHGSNIALSAVAATGSTFVKWVGGPCNDSAIKDCALNNLGSNQAITAQFGVAQRALTTSVSGPGTVTSGETTPLIQCGNGNVPCSANYNHGTSVTLTAAKVLNGRFVSWGGACSGSQSQCIVSMTQAQNVTASFVATFGLTVELVGTGVGGLNAQVSGNGLTCSRSGGVCTVTLDKGVNVLLTAGAPKWANFSGFSANCPPNSSGGCGFSIQQDTKVQAAFAAVGALMFVTSTRVVGTFGGAIQGDKICSTLAEDQQLPGPWVAWVSDANSQPRAPRGGAGRLTTITGDTPLVRIDGVLIAKAGFTQVASGGLGAPVALDEKGNGHEKIDDTSVWTATLPSGSVNLDDATYCTNWRSEVGVIPEGMGDLNAVDNTWTFRESTGFPTLGGFDCSKLAHLYCVRDLAL